MRDYGQCPACGIRFKPGRTPRIYPTTCPSCGETLRVPAGRVWANGLLGALASVLVSLGLGFRGAALYFVTIAMWVPAFLASAFLMGLIWQPRFRRSSEPDRFESPVSIFRKTRR